MSVWREIRCDVNGDDCYDNRNDNPCGYRTANDLRVRARKVGDDHGPFSQEAKIPTGDASSGAANLRVVAAAYEIAVTTGDPRALPTILSAPPPARHHNLAGLVHHGQEAGLVGLRTSADQSGFLLSDGTFASRRRAACVAIAAGQVAGDALTVPGLLFSEDLW